MADHTTAWDNDAPQGSVAANTLDTVIQTLKDDLVDRLSQEHVFQDEKKTAAQGKHRFAILRMIEASTSLMGTETLTVGDGDQTYTHTLTSIDGTAVVPDWVKIVCVGGLTTDGTALTSPTNKEFFPSMDAENFMHITQISSTQVTLELGPMGLGLVPVSGVMKSVFSTLVKLFYYYLETAGADEE